MSKIPVYIAGDSNIFMPGVVCLNSIKVRNPDIYEYYMCFDGADLTVDKKIILEKYGIKFLDSKCLKFAESVFSVGTMKEGSWPKEVIFNWLVPNYFHLKGYQVAIKIDYDVICLSQWNWKELEPGSCLFSARYWNQNLSKDGVSQDIFTKLNVSPSNKYFNVGFCVINLDKFVHLKFFEKFIEIYRDLLNLKFVSAAEQVAISLAITSLKADIRQIPSGYNQRVTTLPELDSNGKSYIKNLHFITSNKPWKPLSFKYLRHYVDKGNRSHLYMYRSIWINEALKLPEARFYIDLKKMSEIEYIDMMTMVFNEIYSN